MVKAGTRLRFWTCIRDAGLGDASRYTAPPIERKRVHSKRGQARRRDADSGSQFDMARSQPPSGRKKNRPVVSRPFSSFSGKGAHRVRRDTQIELTPYRLEVKITKDGKDDSYRIIRRWDEAHLPDKSSDPNAPLENRIDVSPSNELSDVEKKYVGQSDGQSVGYILLVGAFFLLFMAGVWGWWPPVGSAVAGILIIFITKTEGNTEKIVEVRTAKERIRQHAEEKLRKAMQDIRVWAALDGIGFENAVSRIYRDKGYNVESTPRSNDQGVDLILRKNGTTGIVQCKAYSKNVGVAAVRELAGVRASWPNVESVVLVALFDFTKSAKQFAQQHDIELFSIARDYLKTDYRPGT